jgi:hypothetical protein
MKVFPRPASRALSPALLTLATLFSVISPLCASAQTPVYDRGGPWWNIIPRPLLSMAYTPEPSDYGPQFVGDSPATFKYFDSDFYNSDFKLLWGPGGRDDLRTLGQIRANNLHLYDWSPCRDHVPFLNYAQANGMSVWVPFSNYFVNNPYDPARRADIQAIVREIYGLNAQNQGRKTHHPAAVLWGIGNEFDQDRETTPAKNVAEVARIVVQLESDAGIPDSEKLVFTSPVSFAALNGQPAAIDQILELQQAFIAAGLSDVWYKRFLASTATTNDGPFMDNYIRNTFPAAGDFSKGSGLPLFLSEYGANGQDACLNLHRQDPACRVPAQQALRDQSQQDYNSAEFTVAMQLDTTPATSKTGYFYGFSVFQWQDAFWKCPNEICTESQFGIQKRAAPLTQGTIGGGRCGIPVNQFTYPVINLQHKLAWDSTVHAFAQ